MRAGEGNLEMRKVWKLFQDLGSISTFRVGISKGPSTRVL